MEESMYLLDFRRMRVEKIVHPEPPAGIDIGTLDVGKYARSAEITFTASGSRPVAEDEE